RAAGRSAGAARSGRARGAGRGGAGASGGDVAHRRGAAGGGALRGGGEDRAYDRERVAAGGAGGAAVGAARGRDLDRGVEGRRAMSSAFVTLEDAINAEAFPEVDLALRRGRHVDRDDADWYAFLIDAQEKLEPFYRRFGCELVHKTDGYFYLLPTNDKL